MSAGTRYYGLDEDIGERIRYPLARQKMIRLPASMDRDPTWGRPGNYISREVKDKSNIFAQRDLKRLSFCAGFRPGAFRYLELEVQPREAWEKNGFLQSGLFRIEAQLYLRRSLFLSAGTAFLLPLSASVRDYSLGAGSRLCNDRFSIGGGITGTAIYMEGGVKIRNRLTASLVMMRNHRADYRRMVGISLEMHYRFFSPHPAGSRSRRVKSFIQCGYGR
jgi:hypothetical protein